MSLRGRRREPWLLRLPSLHWRRRRLADGPHGDLRPGHALAQALLLGGETVGQGEDSLGFGEMLALKMLMNIKLVSGSTNLRIFETSFKGHYVGSERAGQTPND